MKIPLVFDILKLWRGGGGVGEEIFSISNSAPELINFIQTSTVSYISIQISHVSHFFKNVFNHSLFNLFFQILDNGSGQ